jgi:hypothetical protein
MPAASRKASINLEKAVGTENHTKHAKCRGLARKPGFT